MKKLIALILALILILPAPTICAEEKPDLKLTSVSAVLMEASTGQVIYAKDKDKELIPASITKIMTLYLIMEQIQKGKLKLSDKVTVSEYAASMGGSQVFLEPGETQTVKDMIKCIAIASANDAAVAMAEKIAGSEESFAKKMNATAKELGMKHTHFLNCCGLDDKIESGHYTSAYDVALVSRALITRHPEISKYSTIWMDKIKHVTKKGTTEFGLTNTNKLVRFYNGITGLKTGSTSKAKFCLSATAKRDGMDLIAVVMAAPDVKARFGEASSLLDYGFSKCSIYKDDMTKLKITPQKISGAKEDTISPVPADTFSKVFTDGTDTSKITKKISYNLNITAPIKKGAVIGKITYFLGKRSLGEINLIAPKDMERAGFSHLLSKILSQYFRKQQ